MNSEFLHRVIAEQPCAHTLPLADALLGRIASLLPARDVLQLESVGRQWRRAVHAQTVWQQLPSVPRPLPLPLPPPLARRFADWSQPPARNF